MDRRSSGGLDSEVLAVHMCYLFLEMVLVWMEDALRRSEGERDGVLEAGIWNAVAVLPDLQRIC